MRRLIPAITLFTVAASIAGATEVAPQPELAKLIEQLTSRDVKPWQTAKSGDGIFSLDTNGGFQHVALAKSSKEGLTLGCVASLDEAKGFLGRDIASGRILPHVPSKESPEALAQRHGMAPEEYVFYSEMIAHWKSGGAKAGATITIVNGDGAGEGFNSAAGQLLPAPGNDGNANLGAQRLALFEAAADVWAAFLDSEIEIRVGAQFNVLSPCTASGGVLGSAGSNGLFADTSPLAPNAEFLDTVYPAALLSKQLGQDVNGGSVEINTTFNSDVDAGCLGPGTRFYYGLDNATPSGTVNLFVVVLHELGHGLGFASYAAQNGSRPGNLPDIWARKQLDVSTGKTWFQMSDAERAASAVNTGNLFWDGPNVRQASAYLSAGRQSATGRVQLYAPNPYEGGSSVSHYAKTVAPNVLMEPSINAGLNLDLDLTRQLMRDIGWFRDSNLDGAPDAISSVQPSGGVVTIGSSQTISWNQPVGFNRNVTIELSTDGGANWSSVIAEDVSNTGSRSWTVPNTPTNQARIRVREHDFVAPAGSSSLDFVIASANTAPSFVPAAPINRQRGSSPGVAVSVGTASDAETSAGSLEVTQIGGGSSSGISTSAISNSSGSISAVVSATCSASAGTLRFQVSDGELSGSGDLSVTLSNNTPPTLGYANSNITGGSGGIISPNNGPADNGTISALSLFSVGTYTGGASLDGAGVLTLANAAPVGTHTLVVRATDNCGSSTDASFQLSVDNSAPSFTPASSLSRQQGSPAGAAVMVGTVSDAQSAASSLSVSAIAGGSASGLSVGMPSNSGGSVSATIAASCTASAGTQRFQVSDGSLTGSGDLQVDILANTPPLLDYDDATLAFGGAAMLTPGTAPSDNGTVDTLIVLSTGSFSGSASVDSAGVVSLGNAGPVGDHTITIRATDNCGAQRDASFTLTVPNTAPQFSVASGITRQQGSPESQALIGTASDAQSGAASLVASLISGGTASGLSVGSVGNSDGVLSAPISAGCNAASGSLRFSVSDGDLSTSGDLAVTVEANALPTLGYGSRSLLAGGNASVSPLSGPADNGSVVSIVVHDPGTYSGGVTVDSLGVVGLSNAAPEGVHTLVIRATDNCGASRDANLQISVGASNTPPAITTATGLQQQQGSPASDPVVIASVQDAETAAGSLVVSIAGGGTASGITIEGLDNDGGSVSARVSASCAATTGSIQLAVDDGADSTTGALQVEVLANTAPDVGAYPDPLSVPLGASLTINPDASANDNGSIESVAIQIAPTFSGTLQAAGLNGTLQLTNAGPLGEFPVTVSVRDNCNAVSERTLRLRVEDALLFLDGFEAP